MKTQQAVRFFTFYFLLFLLPAFVRSSTLLRRITFIGIATIEHWFSPLVVGRRPTTAVEVVKIISKSSSFRIPLHKQ